jgi:hypothetical protein
MPKAQVSTALPIEFSEVCEVVYQDTAGTNGRSLNQAFIDATLTFDPTYQGSKDRLQNFRGYPVLPTLYKVLVSSAQGGCNTPGTNPIDSSYYWAGTESITNPGMATAFAPVGEFIYAGSNYSAFIPMPPGNTQDSYLEYDVPTVTGAGAATVLTLIKATGEIVSRSNCP